jgi:hypothetical protein
MKYVILESIYDTLSVIGIILIIEFFRLVIISRKMNTVEFIKQRWYLLPIGCLVGIIIDFLF